MYLVTVVKEFYSESPGCEVAGLFTTPENAALAKEKVEAYLTKEEYEDFQVFVSFMQPDHLAYYEMEETIATAPVMKEGSYTSVWDDGTTLVSRCIVNMSTRQVTILDSFDMDVQILEDEFLTLDGETQAVCSFTELSSSDQFWYE